MGDIGFLKAATSQYRAHVYLSDVVRLGGQITAKEIDGDGDHVVHLTTWARNQRDKDVMPGTATITLPTRKAITDSDDDYEPETPIDTDETQ